MRTAGAVLRPAGASLPGVRGPSDHKRSHVTVPNSVLSLFQNLFFQSAEPPAAPVPGAGDASAPAAPAPEPPGEPRSECLSGRHPAPSAPAAGENVFQTPP